MIKMKQEIRAWFKFKCKFMLKRQNTIKTIRKANETNDKQQQTKKQQHKKKVRIYEILAFNNY